MKGYDPFTPDAGFDTEPVFDAPPPRPRGANIEGMRKALMRSNTRLLLSAVMLFQFTAMLLISLQERPVDTPICFNSQQAGPFSDLYKATSSCMGEPVSSFVGFFFKSSTDMFCSTEDAL